MAEKVPPTPGDPEPDVDDVTNLSGDPVVQEAHKRFMRCAEWEANARERFLDDLKFANGDADNGYQWPNAIRRARDVDTKPCLTLNIVRQHNLQIVNDSKQNKSSVAIKATGNGATKESADVFKGIVRHIEYISNAADAYSTASEFQVEGGIGFWRLTTDYAGPDTFDQEIYIRRIWDPLSVYLDPDIQEKDGSDAKFGFVFDTVPKDEFDEAYPEFKDQVSLQPMGVGSGDDDWVSKDHVRICEYFRKVPKKDKVLNFVDPATGVRKTIRASKLNKEMRQAVLDDPQTKWRTIHDSEVEWKLIVGEKVIEETIWPGKYIPLIRVIGEETVIEGILDRKGHTRAMKDGQRMYNYNASSQVEFVALQSKTPWIAPAKAIEEYESLWNTANNVNHSVLVFNHIDDEGNPIPPPFRQDPPVSSNAYQQGMDTAFNQLMMTSGQYQNQMGMQGNERTGAAIQKRQAQGDTATFHFIDNFATAIRFTGKQLLDLIPKVYDTKRVLKILADDGTDTEVEIDPAAKQAYQQKLGQNNVVVKRIFNPAVGEYDVMADVGPAFGTRREETVQALTLILTQAPALTGIIGDLLLSAMDFKEAQEAAQRLKRMVPPQALGTGPTQQEQQLTASVQSLQAALAKALDINAKEKLKLVGKDQMRDIDVYKAETERFKAFSKAFGLDEGKVKQALDELVDEATTTKLQPILDANKDDLSDQGGDSAPAPAPSPAPAETPPMPGARKAPDGEWYMNDPSKKGGYLRIRPLVQKHKARGIVANA